MHHMPERVESVPDPIKSAIASIGIIGGTGALGRGLAHRFAIAGLAVVIGSRDAERARSVSATLPGQVTGGTHADACRQDATIIAVPWLAHGETLVQLTSLLDGRLVVDAVNPLDFDEHGPFALQVAAGSAAQEAQLLLPGSTVVAAFHHLSAGKLRSEDALDSDVMVVGDDQTAVNRVVSLINAVEGLRGIAAGRLRDAQQLEAMTANIIAINRRYRVQAGVRVTGLDEL